MTEAEAKTKWCPKYQIAAATGDVSIFESDNRPYRWSGETPPKPVALHEGACCIGSACMAWRWDRDGWSLKFDANGPVLASSTQEAHGYCGLAGKP